jgi:site-specific DNA recombinase
MMDDERLGREQIETAYLLKQIITAGVRVFYYLDDRERRPETPTDKLLMSVAGFASEVERVKAQQRTRDGALKKAKSGYVTGGRKFGYDNIQILGLNGQRSHVDRRVHPIEAAVVLRIFRLADQGYGFRRIAHTVNAEAAPTPRARQGRQAGWSASTVREVLRSEIYRGQIIWGRTAKRDAWGQRQTRATARRRPPDDWIRVERPDLRIVPEDLWLRVQARLRESNRAYLRSTDGRLQGRPLNGIAAKYLLTGLVGCGLCGGSLTIRTRSHGTGRLALYGCLTHHTKGPRICPNRTLVRQRDAEQAILGAVRHDLLRPDVLDEAIGRVLDSLDPEAAARETTRLQTDLVRLDGECRRLADVIASTGGEAESLMTAIRAREHERARAEGRLAELGATSQVARMDRVRLARDLRARLTDWQGLILTHPQQARQGLKKLLEGRLAFTPTADGTAVEFSGQGRLDPILAGVIEAWNGLPKAGVSPTGFEPVFPCPIRCPLPNQPVGARDPSESGAAWKFGPGFQAAGSRLGRDPRSPARVMCFPAAVDRALARPRRSIRPPCGNPSRRDQPESAGRRASGPPIASSPSSQRRTHGTSDR